MLRVFCALMEAEEVAIKTASNNPMETFQMKRQIGPSLAIGKQLGIERFIRKV
jgi:hypothetical protein